MQYVPKIGDTVTGVDYNGDLSTGVVIKYDPFMGTFIQMLSGEFTNIESDVVKVGRD
jgi:hypothetical protein